MSSKMYLAFVAVMLLVAMPVLAAVPFSDDFNDNNADGWTEIVDAEWAAGGGIYTCTTPPPNGHFSTAWRPDVAVPDEWSYEVDVMCPSAHSENITTMGGIGLGESATEPWNNYFRVYAMWNGNGDHVNLMIHYQTGAWESGWQPVGYAGTNQWYHMTVTHAAGASTIDASMTDGVNNWNVTSGDLSAKLGTCVYPGLVVEQNPQGVNFDNVNIIPEPTTMMLLGLGGLAGWLRKKRA